MNERAMNSPFGPYSTPEKALAGLRAHYGVVEVKGGKLDVHGPRPKKEDGGHALAMARGQFQDEIVALLAAEAHAAGGPESVHAESLGAARVVDADARAPAPVPLRPPEAEIRPSDSIEMELRSTWSPTGNFTMVPNIFLDVILGRADLSSEDKVVIMYLIRRIHGFPVQGQSPRGAYASIQQITEGKRSKDGALLDHGCGLSRNGVRRALRRLSDVGILVVTPQHGDHGERGTNFYELNFHALPPLDG